MVASDTYNAILFYVLRSRAMKYGHIFPLLRGIVLNKRPNYNTLGESSYLAMHDNNALFST